MTDQEVLRRIVDDFLGIFAEDLSHSERKILDIAARQTGIEVLEDSDGQIFFGKRPDEEQEL